MDSIYDKYVKFAVNSKVNYICFPGNRTRYFHFR